MKAKHVKLGVKYAGTCAMCGEWTGDRSFELAATSLYKRDDGKFCAVHPICAGGKTKNRCGNRGVAYRVEPDQVIEVSS